RDPAAMVSGHLLDSLSVVPHLPAGSLLDLGCGAGFPGLPIAIVDPERPVTLLDSNQKKTRFVQHAIAQLGLKNSQVVHQRVQHYLPQPRFDTVICRAYSALSDFVEQADSLLQPNGTLIAMKGQHPTAELASLPTGWQVTACEPVAVPDLNQPRHLLLLQRDQAITRP
ncbi:MAG: 16S rRNA (guanine(527)-N(7))-methyltransferase RsmG, partial [Gammaproteobacteria bacterium]